MTRARRLRSIHSLEFQPGNGDDSWYCVSLRLHDDKLRVHYECFSDKCDEEIGVADVESVKKLYAKFRLPSRRLADDNCQEVTPGCKVCVSSYPAKQESTESVRYFDAHLEKVSRLKHILVNREEQCNCTYDVIWLAGPNMRERDTVYCENIYLLQSGSSQTHPVLKEFVKLLQCKKDCKSQFNDEKFMIKWYNLRNTGNPQADELIPTNNGSEFYNVDGSSNMIPYHGGRFDNEPLDIRKDFNGKIMCKVDVVFPHKREEMKDVGKPFPCSLVLLLENLEKDVTPSDVLGVIHQATSGLVKVYISPSRKFETFTRGFVCFKDRASFEKAYAYLQSETISIVSSNGRPWVVIDVEHDLCEGSFGGLTTAIEVLHPSFGSLVSNKIRILDKGTPEYERAEKLKQRFLEWRKGGIELHRILGEEESEIERDSSQ